MDGDANSDVFPMTERQPAEFAHVLAYHTDFGWMSLDYLPFAVGPWLDPHSGTRYPFEAVSHWCELPEKPA